MAIKNIMVVEDDLIIQLFICRALQSAGFNVVGEARTCDQTLEVLSGLDALPDLVLMDIGLAGDKDGIETAELINQKFSIPIVFITGNSDEPTLHRARKVDPLEFIFKPIDEIQLKNFMLDLSERMGED